MNKELYDQLIEAGTVLVQREETEETIRIYTNKIEEQNNTLEKARKDIKKKPKFFVGRLVFGIIATYFGGAVTLAFGFGAIYGLLGGVFAGATVEGGLIVGFVSGIMVLIMIGIMCTPFLIMLAVGIILLISIPLSKKRHAKKATAKYEKLKADFEEKNKILEEEINRLSEELSDYLAENGKYIEFLPLDYQTVHAVGFMLKAVQNLRADTLKEAINLYDQELKHLEAMAAAERQRLQNENMIYAMQLLNRSMESMSESQARTNRILSSIDAVQTINMVHNW